MLLGLLFREGFPGAIVDVLDVDERETDESSGEWCAGGLKCGGQACLCGGIGGRMLGEKFAESFAAAGGGEEGWRHGEVIEIPLRDAGAALAATERDFGEGGVAFIALGAELVAEDAAGDFYRSFFISIA